MEQKSEKKESVGEKKPLDEKVKAVSSKSEEGGKMTKQDTSPTVETENEKKEQARTKIKKELFLKIYGDSLGSVHNTCAKVGIARNTFYTWKKEDADFREALMLAWRMKLEDVEELANIEMMKGDGAMIRHFLDRRHPLYRPRVKFEGPAPGEKSLEEEFDELEFVDDEEYEEYEKQNNQSQGDREADQAEEQAGNTGAVPAEPGAKVLLEETKEAEHNREVPAKGANENH